MMVPDFRPHDMGQQMRHRNKFWLKTRLTVKPLCGGTKLIKNDFTRMKII